MKYPIPSRRGDEVPAPDGPGGQDDGVEPGNDSTLDLKRALGLTQERLRLLIEQVTDYAIISLDTDGVVDFWNSGAARLKGYTAAEALGRHHSIFYTEEDRGTRLPERLLAQARSDGRVQHLGWRLRADGSRFWADVTLTAIRDHDGAHTGYAKVTRDLTERHELEQNRDAFLAALAHDFRGPLTAILGYVGLREPSGPDPDPTLRRIRANAERLDQMLGDLLVNVRSPATLPAPGEIGPVDVLAVARRTIENLGTMAGMRRVEVAPGTATALADAAALERVVANLVANAARYSETGPIVVGAHRDSDWVRLVVSDEGRGITAEDLPAITEPYRRGRLADEVDGGLGLGLSSVRALVEQQGGVLEIASEVGVGTVVTVSLHTAP